jgi:type I restriction enzyme M protein
VKEYLAQCLAEAGDSAEVVAAYRDALADLREKMTPFLDAQAGAEGLQANRRELAEAEAAVAQEADALAVAIGAVEAAWPDLPADNTAQHRAAGDLAGVVEASRTLIRAIEHATRGAQRLVDRCEREFDARKAAAWENAAINRLRKGLAEASEVAVAQLRQIGYFHRQVAWLQERFPDAALRDVEGLVKVVTLAEIEAQDWSLTPGRYVGVAPPEEEDGFDFEQALREIHAELAGLNAEAAELAALIQGNFGELM